MRISIIILNYNQSDILEYTLHSLSNQNSKYNFEIIITDDGSKNEHINKIFKIIEKYKNLEIYYIFQQDTGFNISKARNNAIKMARGNLIITLDGDIIPKNSFIEEHTEMHMQNKNILVYSNREFKDFNELSFENLYNKTTNLNNIKLEKDEIKIKKKSMYGWQKAWGFNVSFLKKSFTLYNEKFIGWGLEDVEFAYKLEKIYNYQVKNLNSNVIHINKKIEKIYNPYITKDKQQLKLFLLNALTIIKTYKNNSNEFIKMLYIPNINNKDNLLSKNMIPFFNNFINGKYFNYTEKNLYKIAIIEIEKIIKIL